jgi:hypothetical protein
MVPATGLPSNTIVVIALAEQTVCDDGVAVADGIGFTVTVVAIDAPDEQPSAVTITV